MFIVNTAVDAVDAVPGDGICATASGACTLRAAVQEANASAGTDMVMVSAATYVLTIPGVTEDASAAGDLDIRAPLAMTGAGASTVIDAGALDRIFDVHAAAAEVEISSLTLRGGGAGAESGGAIRVIATQAISVSVSHVAFVDNAAVHGGAVAMASSATGAEWPTLTIRRSSFDGNRASSRGGAIYRTGRGQTTVDRSTFGIAAGNSAGADGGAIYSESTSLRIFWSTLVNNVAGGDGGAIRTNRFNSSVGISQTTIARNRATNGGGISTCCAYTAVQPVGLSSTSVHITISTLSTNHATGRGGAAFIDSRFALEHVTVAENTAGTTGGFHLGDADLVQIFYSIISNPAGNCSGAAAHFLGRHSILSDSTCHFYSSLFAEPSTGNLTSTNPLLGPLEDNGGPTPTHALLPGSPAIDFVPLPSSGIRMDQRGVLRPFGASYDAGAFEVSTAAVIATTTTLTLSANPIVAGRPIILRAAVTPGYSSGHVIFRDGGTMLGIADLDPDATLTIPSLPVGPHSITASFSGDLAYASSTSTPVVLNVVASDDATAIPALDTRSLVTLGFLLAAAAVIRAR